MNESQSQNEPRIWTVIQHHRIDRATGKIRAFLPGVSGWKPTCRGGWTECVLYEVPVGAEEERSKWTLRARAISVCSLQDNFCKRIGSRIARGRAINLLTSLPVLQPDYSHVTRALHGLQKKLTRIYARVGRVA